MPFSFAIDRSMVATMPAFTSAVPTPRLSIVVATYNAVQTLERCLQSIFGQTFRDWELLIVDGASADGTVDVIHRHSNRIRYWRSQPDAGIYDAWNHAIATASGEFICFLGADDTWHTPDTLQRVFDSIGDRPFDFVSGRGRLVDCNGMFIEEFGHAWDYRKVARRMTVCHPGALHRRDLFERFGVFDTSYRISADYEFLLRLPSSLRTLFIDHPLVDVADGGVSRERRWLMLRERYRAQAHCPRVGQTRAALNYMDKLWRIPVAKALGIRN
jgi:glycosyltransferase involved in cell wall biosynthesis